MDIAAYEAWKKICARFAAAHYRRRGVYVQDGTALVVRLVEVRTTSEHLSLRLSVLGAAGFHGKSGSTFELRSAWDGVEYDEASIRCVHLGARLFLGSTWVSDIERRVGCLSEWHGGRVPGARVVWIAELCRPTGSPLTRARLVSTPTALRQAVAAGG